MADLSDAAQEFRELARALREVGETGLRRELFKAISDAAKPVAKRIGDVEHLKPYMPDRYAEILAEDLTVSILKRTGTAPGVRLRAKGRRKSRHVSRLERGIITHPVFADPAKERKEWHWVYQILERPHFFSDPARESGPQVRAEIGRALDRVTRQLFRYTRG